MEQYTGKELFKHFSHLSKIDHILTEFEYMVEHTEGEVKFTDKKNLQAEHYKYIEKFIFYLRDQQGNINFTLNISSALICEMHEYIITENQKMQVMTYEEY